MRRNSDGSGKVWRPGLVICGAVVWGLSLTAAQAPAAPSGLSVWVDGTFYSQNSVSVSLVWDIPSSAPLPTGYLVEVGSAPGLNDLANAFTTAEDAAVTTPNVPPGLYYARVRAVNGDAISLPSNEVKVTTRRWLPYNPAVPAAPVIFSSASGGISINGSIVTLSWENQSASPRPTSYIVQAGTWPGMNDLGEVDTRGATSITVSQVPAGTYYMTVRGWNASGLGDATTPVGLIVSPSCSYVVNTAVSRSRSLGDFGGVQIITSHPACPWTATTDRRWFYFNLFNHAYEVSGFGSGGFALTTSVLTSPSRAGLIKVRGVDREISIFVKQ